MAKVVQVEYEGKACPAEELGFTTVGEPWTIYNLEDGTVLKFKQALAKVCRLTETFKPDGDPIYVFQVGTLAHTDAPASLWKKKDKAN